MRFSVLTAATVINRHLRSFQLELRSERDFEETQQMRDGERSGTVFTREVPQNHVHSGQATG